MVTDRHETSTLSRLGFSIGPTRGAPDPPPQRRGAFREQRPISGTEPITRGHEALYKEKITLPGPRRRLPSVSSVAVYRTWSRRPISVSVGE
ncbi:hypothetical protein JTE90_024411 [Oedothorax gibbosus]|uniref:Uncharacterized protein n=1 Tax=Oedothorax gibbosus TaxID=931172 RepID=A0AAV6TEH4_9ARAC|nr:hypothetical protein JTE90_024411 [Oedothorax gibbosus]